MRLLIQSQATGRFLVPDDCGGCMWVHSLRQSGGGVLADPESAHQIISEYCDFDDAPVVIDLDRLGTEADYLDNIKG